MSQFICRSMGSSTEKPATLGTLYHQVQLPWPTCQSSRQSSCQSRRQSSCRSHLSRFVSRVVMSVIVF